MFTKENAYNWLIALSQPQVIRFAILVVLLASKGFTPPSLACDISTCGGGGTGG